MKNSRNQIHDPRKQIHWESYDNMKKRVAEEAKKKEAKKTNKKNTVKKKEGE